MRPLKGLGSAAAGTALGVVAVAAGCYGLHVVRAWRRYGHVPPLADGDGDPLLERFMPACDIVERHAIRVLAPADVTFDAAQRVEWSSHPVVRAIFIGRELLLGADPARRHVRMGLLDEARELGWGVLAEEPRREIVMGAVTKPWEPNVTFRTIPAAEFAAFNEPDYVKIVWTLRADPVGVRKSVFRTETRAIATDARARLKFRRYWSLLSPGIVLIRRITLRQVKHAAERSPDVSPEEAPVESVPRKEAAAVTTTAV